MYKIILAFTFLLAPFFSSFFSYASTPLVIDWSDPQYDYDSVPSQPSKEEETYIFNCYGVIGDESVCASAAEAQVEGATSSSITNRTVTNNGLNQTINIKIFYDYVDPTWGPSNTFTNKQFIGIQEITFKCPPDGEQFLLYSIGRDIDMDGKLDKCYSQPHLKDLIDPDDSCPVGYYKLKVMKDSALQCIPISCDAAGDSKSIWVKGSVYTNNAGTYCDGSCAHSVQGGSNDSGRSGFIAVTGVSTGQSCGQGTDYSMTDGDGSNCNSSDVGTGTNFLSCPNGEEENTGVEEPDPMEPPVDLGDEKSDIDDIVDIPTNEEACAVGDASCEIRNLKEKVEAENTEKKQQDNKLHDKGIKALEKSTTSIVTNITQASNDTANRNADGFKSISDAVGKLADSINDSGGGGGGDGDGDGFCETEGNCSTSIDTKTAPSDGLTGFWVSEYENGLQGVFDEKLIDIRQTEFYSLLDQFKPTFGGGSAPIFQFCFNMGFVNFGCQSLDIDSRVFPAIRIFILITAVFLCRRILFGG